MKVQIIHAGDFKEKYLKEAFLEYTKRIAPMAEVQDILIKERNVSNPADIKRALLEEGEDILSHISERAFVFALCVEGKQLSSEELSEKIESVTSLGHSTVTFIIGSSHGLSDEVKERSNFRLSFSKMTFPHQLMRVILAEQIYRAFSIIKGLKYHK